MFVAKSPKSIPKRKCLYAEFLALTASFKAPHLYTYMRETQKQREDRIQDMRNLSIAMSFAEFGLEFDPAQHMEHVFHWYSEHPRRFGKKIRNTNRQARPYKPNRAGSW